MGYLFENMEKIDIQAERKAAEDARKEAAKQIEDARREAAKQLEDAKKEMAKQLEDVQKILEALESEKESEKESDKESMLENMIIICQEMGGTRELAAAKLQEKCGLGLEEAKDRVARYWK